MGMRPLEGTARYVYGHRSSATPALGKGRRTAQPSNAISPTPTEFKDGMTSRGSGDPQPYRPSPGMSMRPRPTQ